MHLVARSYEDPTTREGIMYLMAQLHSPNTLVEVALSHAGGWPLTIPAPAIVRHVSNKTFASALHCKIDLRARPCLHTFCDCPLWRQSGT